MRFLSIAALVLALITSQVPAAALQSYAERAREHVLSNGLKVLLMEDHKAPVAVMQIWYRVGSRNEQPGHTGLAHMLEHMMFKGTKKHGPDDYSRIIGRNGGNENAFTTDDATAYFATLASDRIDVALELEADRMHNLAFAPELFDPELHVVMEERRMRVENSPTGILFEQMRAVAYSAHPYQWPVIGWMSDLEQLTRGDALDFYRRHYQPNNALVVVVGDFESTDLLQRIQAHFGDIARRPPPPVVRAIEPSQLGERRVTVRRPAELPYVALAYHVPSIGHDDAIVLEVISALLAAGRSSRLYEDLVYQRRLARSANASYDMLSIDPTLFYAYAQPFPGQSTADLESALAEHLQRLKNTPVSASELRKAQVGLESDFVLAQDSLFYQAMLLGQHEISGDWRRLDHYLPQLSAVTPDDILRVARYYFTDENRTVATLVPVANNGASE